MKRLSDGFAVVPAVPRLTLLATALIGAQLIGSAAIANDVVLDPVVVSASRVEQRISETAASVNVINSAQIHDGLPQINLSEPLARVPGLAALNRQNYAQDLLISSRGFGSNSAFGVRGIQIFVDGIPGTVADGQGQVSHIDLPSAERIEVLRGPFSALYGNASGGVISVFTKDGGPGNEISAYGSGGSFNTYKYGAEAAGEQGGIHYVLGAGKMTTDGYRDHSKASRDNVNAKLKTNLGDDTSLMIVANHVKLDAEDPLGLTATQIAENRRQAGSYAVAYDTRKSVEQAQGGASLAHFINADNSVTLSAYYGQRSTKQYLSGSDATGATAQTNGVIDLSRNFYGADLKWVHTGKIGALPGQLVVGMTSNQNDDHRMTFNNVAGVQQPAISTNQNFSMMARNFDQYVQGELNVTDRLKLSSGLRNSSTTLEANSNNTLPSLGSKRHAAVTGMMSAQYQLQPRTSAYLSWGTSFDTPTLNQILYSSSFVQGSTTTNNGNIGLAPARTQQLELGVKAELASQTRLHAAVFDAETNNDIVVGISKNGRTSYTNAPKTRRIGFELSATQILPWQLQANLAYTALRATVVDGYDLTVGNAVTPIASGSRLPGAPTQMLYGELMWQRPDRMFEAAVEMRAAANMMAKDDNTASAAGYGVAAVRVVARKQIGHWSLSAFARIDNLFDRDYVGSVIVNQSNARFYESAPGRNWAAGAKAVYRF